MVLTFDLVPPPLDVWDFSSSPVGNEVWERRGFRQGKERGRSAAFACQSGAA